MHTQGYIAAILGDRRTAGPGRRGTRPGDVLNPETN